MTTMISMTWRSSWSVSSESPWSQMSVIARSVASAAISSQILEALRLPAPGAPPLRDPAVRGALADRDLHQDELDVRGPMELTLAVQAVRVGRSSHQIAHGAPPGGVPGGTWIPRAA